MNVEQSEREVALLSQRQSAELISAAQQPRHAHGRGYRREVTDRPNGSKPPHRRMPEDFGRSHITQVSSNARDRTILDESPLGNR